MGNPLPPNVVKAVVREVMASKNAVLDAIQEELVRVLTPTIAEHAAVLVMASIDPDPREDVVDELENVLCTLRDRIQLLLSIDDPIDQAHEMPITLDSCVKLAETAIQWTRNRRMELRGESPSKAPLPAQKGGAA